MAEKVVYVPAAQVDEAMLLAHIKASGFARVDVVKVWGPNPLKIYYDGTAAGREQLRDAISAGLRAQFESDTVSFEGEKPE
ncbi:hypothetical protein [Kribbella sp. CA-293567]|uniref:hypothetical protein n=1 Tax=Kribbella sp. CA-293567 TaxID=3002436 RepID=UPI0022DE9692|nr:hypothetical protein [Kribbella sp. CA-293567]WBQ03230.1 hypothetical protein OX958_24995 [Kribbella sp. CA-293567]